MKSLFRGFHLIEVLFTLTILSITIALGYPMYADYLVQAKRADAKTTLNQLALAMEEFHVSHDTYEHATLTTLKFPEIIAKKSYHLSIQHAGNSDYLITATPIGKQAQKDKECAILSLRANNEKNISGYGSVENCWA